MFLTETVSGSTRPELEASYRDALVIEPVDFGIIWCDEDGIAVFAFEFTVGSGGDGADAGDVEVEEGVGAEMLGDRDLALPQAGFFRQRQVLGPHAGGGRTLCRA